MKAFLWVLFIVVVGGIVWYGFARTILLTILMAGGLFVGSAAAWGVWEAGAKRLAALRASAPPDVLRQAKALRDCPSTATDAELAELRRLAGL